VPAESTTEGAEAKDGENQQNESPVKQQEEEEEEEKTLTLQEYLA
jgi:hypothetical protein